MMPLKNAHVWIALLLPLIVVAFWPSYFGTLGKASWAYHLHGITATLWVGALILQSWAIHNKRVALHRLAGKTSLALVPVFLAGGFAVLTSMTRRADPFGLTFGYRLALIDFITVFAFGYFCYAGLKSRRAPQVHSRYLVATIFLVFSPIFARLFMRFVPSALTPGLAPFDRFALFVHLSHVLAAAIVLRLFLLNRQYGRPFLLTIAVLVLQSVAFEWIALSSVWSTLMDSYRQLPNAAVLAFGLLLGVACVAVGWRRGEKPNTAAS